MKSLHLHLISGALFVALLFLALQHQLAGQHQNTPNKYIRLRTHPTHGLDIADNVATSATPAESSRRPRSDKHGVNTLQRRAPPLNYITLPPIDEAKYDEFVCTGTTLMASMENPMPATLPQATFISRCDPLMERYGWRKSMPEKINLGHIDTALSAFGITVPFNEPRRRDGRFGFYGEWVSVIWTHAAEYRDPVTGQTKPAANKPAMGPNQPDYKAFSIMQMNGKAGLIITNQRYTPHLEPRDLNPALRSSSDIMFLNYYHNALQGSSASGQDPVQAPRNALCVTVVNAMTISTIKYVFAKNNLATTDWPGHVFETSTDDGKAMLATPNVKGFTYMLIQHKRQFGDHRSVKSVRVWFPEKPGNAAYRYPNIHVEFADRVRQS